ncbi:MAG: hypothetical protein IPJ88_05860 [Myxococcales bacterium]|nr:MAG: hypothetical protein IPJ88_05860 [Myxococcales bacterium]
MMTQSYSDEGIADLVRNNPGQGTEGEYRYFRDVILTKSPCNLLIFGVGKDSQIWIDANKGGRTVFIEHEPEWIKVSKEHIPDMVVHQVSYETKRSAWKRLLNRQDLLFMEDLPDEVLSTAWDVIYVDSPQGGNPRRPGRMKSIYTASVLARRHTDVDVLFHDCDREVEKAYTDRYFGSPLLVKQTERIRHYRLRPAN